MGLLPLLSFVLMPILLLDENDPENLVTLHSYLKREQYGSAPLLNGQYWNSEMAPQE